MALPPPDPGSTCLVTGASSGIGADIARELARRGHGVTLAARREDRLRDLADELTDLGVRAEAIGCDVTDGGSRERLAKQIDEAEGEVQRLEARLANKGFVNNAPANIVAGAREQLAAAQERLARLRERHGVLA